MPTGYTAAIKDGISFKQYAMNCARAFGALVDMRDSPSDAEPPERFEPSHYRLDALAKERAALAELESLSASERDARATQEADKADARKINSLKEASALQQKYEAMLADVRAWNPPSESHEGLRDFMEKQILESIKWDCGTESYETPAERLTGSEWFDKTRAGILSSIAYHQKEHAAEVERTEKRNEWLRLLRESLKEIEAA